MLGRICHELEAIGQPRQGVRYCIGGGCQQFAQDKRHKLPLACRQSVERVLLQVIGNEVVKALLFGARYELLYQGVPIGELDVFEDLLAQCPLADRLEPLLKFSKIRVPGEPGKLSAKALEVAKREIVDDADKSIELKKRILQRRGRQKRLLVWEYGLFDRLADLVGGFVDVAQAVRLIDDHQIPGGLPDIRFLGAGKLVGANNSAVAFKRVEVPCADRLIECAGLKDGGRQEELVGKFLTPLLAEIRRTYYQQTAFPLGPLLCEQDARFDCLPEADLVGKNCSLRKR